jgi:hypothetical protein
MSGTHFCNLLLGTSGAPHEWKKHAYQNTELRGAFQSAVKLSGKPGRGSRAAQKCDIEAAENAAK